MATRLYLSNFTERHFLPTVDSSWEVAIPSRKKLISAKTSQDEPSNIQQSTALNSPAGAVDAVNIQYISPPLNGSQTISGQIKGQALVNESAAAGDLRMQCVIRVIQSDGTTVRGTLVASDASALTDEFVQTTMTNREFPLGAPVTPTSVGAQDGDRIVIELGFRKHESALTNRTSSLRAGHNSASATDLPEDSTDTDATKAAWVEFADTLLFDADTVPVLMTPNGEGSNVLATGSATIACSGAKAGQLVLVSVLQDGTGSDATLTAVAGTPDINGLDGTTTPTKIATVAVGSPQTGKLHVWIGRASADGAANASLTTSGDDLYYMIHRFARAHEGTTLAEVIENDASTHASAAATNATIADVGVVTNGTNRVAINAVGIVDDNAIDAYTGETGGDWLLAGTNVSATGTDGAIGLQTAEMLTAGTINGGTDTQADATDGWGVIGFALIGVTASGLTYEKANWAAVDVDGFGASAYTPGVAAGPAFSASAVLPDS